MHMGFTISVIIVSLLYLALLELSKNMIIGWCLALIGIVLMFVYRAYFMKKGKYDKMRMALMWVIFISYLMINYLFTGPVEKRVPAVDNKNPDVTEVVHVASGDITGVYNEDHSVRVFAGIPYAEAPVGELRFREPVAKKPWDGVLACDSFGPMAMQPRNAVLYDSLSRIIGFHDYRITIGDEYVEPMSEDCLYLNVYAPEKGDELKPVVFYIHGGSLNTGQSYYTEYRGETFAKEGVIFVNFAYRLGPFGYYAADDLKAESENGTTGNYGLLDQIAALKWVYDNIETFGGDKNKITIAGESAGSSSVNALCVSPLTEGLFRYAIAESSSVVAKKPFHTFRTYEEAIEQGDILRKELGVTSSAELRSISADKILSTSSKNTAMTIDGYAITEMPYLTYEKGNNHEKALLHGFNAKEADVFMLNIKATKENYEELIAEEIGDYAKEMAEVVPWNLPPRDDHIAIDALGEAKGALNTVYSALWFSYSHHVWNRYEVTLGIPSYEYYFTKRNDSLTNYHAGELPYAYGNLYRHPGLYDEDDYKLSEMMVGYWTNFAKTGDPNGEGLPYWEKRTATSNKVLELGDTVRMVDDPNEKIYEVIDKYQLNEN